MARFEFAPNSKRGRRTRRGLRISTGRDGATVVPDDTEFPNLPWTVRYDEGSDDRVLDLPEIVLLRFPDGREEVRPLVEMPTPTDVPRGTEMFVFGLDDEPATAAVRARGWAGATTSVPVMRVEGDRGDITVEHDWTGAQVAAHAKIGLNFVAARLGPAFALKRQFDLVRSFIRCEISPYPSDWWQPVEQPVADGEGRYPVGHLLHLAVYLKPVRVVVVVALYNQLGFAIQLARAPWEGPLPIPGRWSMFFNPVGQGAPVGQVADLVPAGRAPRDGEIAFRVALPEFR